MAGKTKQSEPKMRLDLRAKMYIVLVICSLMLLASVGVAFFLVGGFGGSEDAASDSAVEPESIITESGYNKEENTIDTTAYSATILPESSDAGQTYVDETLFLGDSNTARMYRMFDFCTYDNAIGSVGMSAKSLATYACVELNNSGSYVTMAKAVAGMQPKRVIITFGTNDLSPSYKALQPEPDPDPGGRVQQGPRRNVQREGLEVPEQRRGAEGLRHRLRQERLCGVQRRHPSDPCSYGSAV